MEWLCRGMLESVAEWRGMRNPTRPEYRQGNTLGADHKHWFRPKFFQQYRMFFRYHVPSKVIVFAWVNDEGAKRAYESSDDAYRVFAAEAEQPRWWRQGAANVACRHVERMVL